LGADGVERRQYAGIGFQLPVVVESADLVHLGARRPRRRFTPIREVRRLFACRQAIRFREMRPREPVHSLVGRRPIDHNQEIADARAPRFRRDRGHHYHRLHARYPTP